MATGKKFYWIKLRTSFLTSDKVDYLLSQKNGANYVVIYQMLCLKAINSDGNLATTIGEVLIPYDVEKIQRDLKHFDIDTIRVALELYKRLGMIYEQQNGIIRITGFEELVGSETDYAKQKRLQRGVDNSVDNVHIEYRDKSIEYRDIEKDIDKDNNKPTKSAYGEYKKVKLTEKEYQKLTEEYKEDTDKIISYFDEYLEEKPYKTKNHYLTIKRWVAKAYYEKNPKKEEVKEREYYRPSWYKEVTGFTD